MAFSTRLLSISTRPSSKEGGSSTGPSISDRLAEQAFGQDAPLLLPKEQQEVQAREDGRAFEGAGERPHFGTGARLLQLLFGPVEVLQQVEDEVRSAAALEVGLEDLVPHVRPAAGELDLRTAARKGVVGGVAVAPNDDDKVVRDDVLPAGGGAARVPRKNGVGARAMVAGPKITKLRPAVAGLEVADGRFIDLHIAARQHLAADFLVNEAQPVGAHADPFAHRLAGEGDAVAALVNHLLPVEREKIAILGDEDLRDPTGVGDAIVQEARRQRSEDGHCLQLATTHILWAHGAVAQEAGRFVVRPLGDLLANAPPLLRAGCTGGGTMTSSMTGKWAGTWAVRSRRGWAFFGRTGAASGACGPKPFPTAGPGASSS